MKVLFATDHYPPFIGGAHRQAQLLATGMASRGHDVTLVTPWHGGLPKLEEEGGVQVHRVKQLRTVVGTLVRSREQRHQPPYPDPFTIRAIRRLIVATEPDIIHTYGWISYSVAVALGRRRIPMLLSARDYGYFCANRTLLRKGAPCTGPAPLKCLACADDYYGAPKGWFAVAGVAASRPALVRKMTGLHSVSSYVHEVNRRFLLGLEPGEDSGLVEVTIPSFQDLVPSEAGNGDGTEMAAQLSRLPSEPFILFVGAFRKVKGLETLFAAYRQLESPPPLVLMGTHERDSPEEFPKEAIVITDAPNRLVMAAWDRALFGVLPSLWPEPLGATVSEAMSRGRPVIGTKLGGHPDMLSGGAGVLVPQGDSGALAEAMEMLIRDPERREAYGRAAAERARDFAGSAVLPRFENAYREVLAAADPPAARRRARVAGGGSMRILMLAQSYAPVVGGEERMVEDLSRELASRGHDVAVATLRQPIGGPVESDGVRVHSLSGSTERLPGLHLDPERRHAPPAPDPATMRDLRRVLDEERPDVVHAHNWIVNSYLPLHRSSGPPLALSMHDYGLLCATKRFLHQGACCSGPAPVKCERCAADYYGAAKGIPTALATRTMEPWVRRRVDVFLPVSRAVRDLCRLGPDDNHRVVPNFIGELPPPPAAGGPEVTTLPPDPFILYVGDVAEDKGALLLADVYKTLAKPPPLVLIGRRFVEGLDQRAGVTVLGPFGRAGVIEAMRRALFVVVPSILPETFGLVALEAAAVGRPVIASAIGGLEDVVVDGETGLLVPPGDGAALSAAIASLLGDEGLRRRLGDAAVQRAGDFSAAAVVPQFEDAYRAAIEARLGSPAAG